MIYSYDVDDSSSSSEDEEEDEEYVAAKQPSSCNSSPRVLNRQMTAGSGGGGTPRARQTNFLFSPIESHPVSSSRASYSALSASCTTTSDAATVDAGDDFEPMLLDLDEVYHSSYCSSPVTAGKGGEAAQGGVPHAEADEWRDMLLSLFGNADSESPCGQKDVFQSGRDEAFATRHQVKLEMK